MSYEGGQDRRSCLRTIPGNLKGHPHIRITIDRFVTLCLTAASYVSVFLILKRTCEW